MENEKGFFEASQYRNPTVCEVGRKVLSDGKTRVEIERFPRGRTFDNRPCYIGYNALGGPV